MIATEFGRGKKHDFRLFKESKIKIHPDKQVNVDSGYQGIQNIHKKSQLPIKKQKKKDLTREQRKENKKKSSERVLNEHVIGKIKRFKIISDKYRNRRKRFCLRFNLIAGFYNFELASS